MASAQGARGDLEALLADGRDWAVPGSYSLVDPYLLVFYNWGDLVGLDMAATYPAWRTLTVRTLQRPEVQRVLAKEQVALS